MGDGEVDQLSPLSLFSLSPGVSNLWIKGTICPSLCLCCHDLCDAVKGVGYRILCSICCTSLHTPFPTDAFPFQSARGLRDSDPSVHMVVARVEVAFVRQGYGSGTPQGSEIVT